MRIITARLVLFSLWVVFFGIYLTTTFLPYSWDQVSIKLVKETMWKFIYVLFPVLASFASFWFVPKLKGEELTQFDKLLMTKSQVYAMFVFTFLCHGLVLLYYYFTTLRLNYKTLITFENPEIISYTENVDDVVKMLVFVSAAALLPIGFVLGEKVTAGSPNGNKPS